MRAARLAAVTMLPALVLLPATSTAASAAPVTGDGATPVSVEIADAPWTPDGTTLLLDPRSTALPLNVTGCEQQPATLRWVLYPNDTSAPVGDGRTIPVASDGSASTRIDVAAEVAASGERAPGGTSWTLGVSCDGADGSHSTVLVPVLMSSGTPATATDAAAVTPGAVVHASAQGLTPGETALIRLIPTAAGAATEPSGEPAVSSGTELGATTTAATGTAGADVVIPASTAPGSYRLVVLGTASSQSSSRGLTVTPPAQVALPSPAGTSPAATTAPLAAPSAATAPAPAGAGTAASSPATTVADTATGTATGAATGTAAPTSGSTDAPPLASSGHRSLRRTGAAALPVTLSAVGVLIIGVYLARRGQRS